MIINEFSIFMSKCEIDGISVLKVMEVTLCVMQNINLTPDSKFKKCIFLKTSKFRAKRIL